MFCLLSLLLDFPSRTFAPQVFQTIYHQQHRTTFWTFSSLRTDKNATANSICALWQPDGMNSNMIMTECESDPDRQMSLHRDADVMATMAEMLQNVNEPADVQNMLSVTCRRWVTRQYSEHKHGSETKCGMLGRNSRGAGRRKTRHRER